MLGSNHTVKLSKSTWHQNEKFGKETVHREDLSKSVNLMSVVLARQDSGKDHMRWLCTKNGAPAEWHGHLANIFSSSRIRTMLRFYVGIAMVMPAPTPNKTRGARIRGKRNKVQKRWAQWRGPETLQWYWLPMGKCATTRRHKCLFIKIWGIGHAQETLQQERREAWELATSVYEKQNADKATFYSLTTARAMPAPSSKSQRSENS